MGIWSNGLILFPLIFWMNLAPTSYHLMLIICLAGFVCLLVWFLVYHYNFIVYLLKCDANEFVASYLRLMSQVTYLTQVKVQVQLPELPVQPQVQVQVMHKMRKNVILFVLKMVR